MTPKLNKIVTTRDHVQWVFPTLDVQSGYGRNSNGTELIGITFGISLYQDSMDTLNHIGMEIDHIKCINDKLIVVVYNRRADRETS
jgi:hypothetical protein